MDEFFGGMEGKYRVSITDSTMMCIVHHAMDKAHEKVKSKEGVVERLNEMSKFYELAVMQLEGCLRFVQEETDSCILESNREEVLSDLKDIRDRLQGRLQESERAISDKDRELIERVENEMKLRHALELKEREVVSLRADLETERKKNEGIGEFVLGNRVDEDRDGEFCELKNAVDQQVWNIKQKLGPDYKLIDEETNRCIDNEKIEQMGLDIDILKETLDLAFEKMQKAIFLSEMRPMELQWKWSIEKDTISILIKGLMRSIQESFEEKVRKQRNQVLTGLSGHWSNLMNEVASLRHQLGPLCSQNDKDVNSVNALNASAPPSIAGDILSHGEREEMSPEDDGCKKAGKSSLKEEEVDHGEKHTEKDQQKDGNHSIAMMEEIHEPAIGKRREGLTSLKQEQDGLSSVREKDPLSVSRTIQVLVWKLDNVMEWNAKLGETLGDHKAKHGEEHSLEKRAMQFDETIDSLADVWETTDKVSVSYAVNEEQQNEIRMLKQEKEDANLQTMIIEETYLILLKGLMKEVFIDFENCDFECLMREGVYKDCFRGTVIEWKEMFESNKTEAQTREEIYSIVFSETLKNYGSTHDFTSSETQYIWDENNILEDSTNTKLSVVAGAVREDIWTAFLREMFREVNRSTEGCDIERLIKEETYRDVVGKSIRSTVNTSCSALNQSQEVKLPDDFLHDFRISRELFRSAETVGREDACMLLFREIVKQLKMEIDAYNMEILLREDIYQFVFLEAAKDAFILRRQAESGIEDSVQPERLSADKPYNYRIISGDDNLIQIPDSLSQCYQEEEELRQRERSEVTEQTEHLYPLGLKSEDREEQEIYEELFVDDEHAFSSVSSKLEKALQQLATCKSLIGELGSSLGITVSDLAKVHDQSHAKDNEEGRLDASDSLFSAPPVLLQVLLNFERIVHHKLGMNILRLEEVKYNLDPLVELLASLRNKELLYRTAFVRRCHNLQRAELEVDLLGDQVDVLQGLLEKIYTTLNRYSPALQQYFEVSDILNLIKKELTGGAVDITNEIRISRRSTK